MPINQVARLRIRYGLILVILATLPCYCAGLLAVLLTPQPGSRMTATPASTRIFTLAPGATFTQFPTFAPFPNGTASPTLSASLTPTPTVLITPTPSPTPFLPPTVSDTPISSPTDTQTPEPTPSSTQTSTSTATQTLAPPSDTPTVTSTPIVVTVIAPAALATPAGQPTQGKEK